MSVKVEIKLPGFNRLQARLRRMSNWDRDGLFDAIGAEAESQTKRRIADEKTTPEGQAWPPWCPEYAGTRHSGHSLLRGEGHLLESITHNVVTDGVEVGSNLAYAGAHNYGVPGRQHARQYLGLSRQNEDDIEAVIDDWIDQEMAL